MNIPMKKPGQRVHTKTAASETLTFTSLLFVGCTGQGRCAAKRLSEI